MVRQKFLEELTFEIAYKAIKEESAGMWLQIHEQIQEDETQQCRSWRHGDRSEARRFGALRFGVQWSLMFPPSSTLFGFPAVAAPSVFLKVGLAYTSAPSKERRNFMAERRKETTPSSFLAAEFLYFPSSVSVF